MFQKKNIEKIKAHILCLVIFFDNRAVYEITPKNIVDGEKPQMRLRRTHISR